MRGHCAPIAVIPTMGPHRPTGATVSPTVDATLMALANKARAVVSVSSSCPVGPRPHLPLQKETFLMLQRKPFQAWPYCFFATFLLSVQGGRHEETSARTKHLARQAGNEGLSCEFSLRSVSCGDFKPHVSFNSCALSIH